MIGIHTWRNSLIAVVTFIGLDIGGLMGGAVVTERIFNINGVGSYIFRSINQKDATSVVGTITVLVLIYLRGQPARRPAVRRPGPEDQP